MIQRKGSQQASPKRDERDLDLADYEALFALSEELICFTNDKGQIKKINPAFAKALGYRESEFFALGLENLIHPEDREKTFDQLRRVLDGKFHGDFESRFQSNSGETLWLLWTLTSLPNRELVRWSARDITIRKNQEVQKDYSDRLLKHTVNSLPFLVAYLDLDFKYQFMNKAYEYWLGELAQVARKGNMEQAVGPDLARLLQVHREEAKRTGLPNRFEGNFKDIQGNRVFLEIQYHPHLNASGKVEGLMALAYDVTKIKQANQSILNIETRLQRVLNTGKIGFWETNLLTKTTTMSDNIREWMGLAAKPAFSSEVLSELVHPEDREKVFSIQKNVVELRKPYEIEFRTRRPDGNYNSSVCTSYPTYDETGNVVAITGIAVDVTERRQIEQTLKSQQAKMMTSSRLSAIGEMASGVAHEINNPLAIIFSNAEALKMNAARGKLTSQAVEQSAGKIETTVMRISKIIHSLRSLSRDSESDPFEPVSIRKIVDDSLEICTQRFKSHQIQLRVDIPNEDMIIYARPTQISQVLLNLLNNAHDAVENLNLRWVEISVRDLKEDVEIAVTDSGSGISPDLKEKIFDPFFTTKEPSKGTGLGLSVSKNIVLAHGGSLQINHQAPTTQFLIRLPKNIRPN